MSLVPLDFSGPLGFLEFPCVFCFFGISWISVGFLSLLVKWGKNCHTVDGRIIGYFQVDDILVPVVFISISESLDHFSTFRLTISVCPSVCRRYANDGEIFVPGSLKSELKICS